MAQFYQKEGEKAIYRKKDPLTGELSDAFKTEQEFIAAGGTPYWQDPRYKSEGYTGNVELSSPEASRQIRYKLPGETPLGESYEDYLKMLGEPVTAQEKTDIFEQTRKNYQTYIDAINAEYARIITGEQEKGVERLGQTRAMAARGGILGMPFGTAQMEKTKEHTAEIIRNIQAERQLKVDAIWTGIDERAEALIKEKKEEAITSAEKHLEYLSSVYEQIREDIKGLAEQGTQYDRLHPDDKEKILEQTGWSEFQLENFWNANLKKEEQTEYTWAWRGNNLVGIGQDPTTGEVKTKTYDATELGLPVGINPNFITNENTGEMFWYDKDNPETDAQGNLILKSIGKFGKLKGEDETEFKFTSDDVGKLIATGLTQAEANNILADIRTHGLQAVIDSGQLKDNQIKVLNEITTGEEEEKQFITYEFIKSQISEEQLERAAKERGFVIKKFWGKNPGDIEKYLTESLIPKIEGQRAAGISEEDIWKSIQNSFKE